MRHFGIMATAQCVVVVELGEQLISRIPEPPIITPLLTVK